LKFPTKRLAIYVLKSSEMAAEVGTMPVAPKAAIMTDPSPNQPPQGVDDNWTKEISKKWEELGKEVQLLATESPGAKCDPDLKPQNVLDNLDQIKKKSKEKDESKWGKFRSILNDTLTVISVVGGLAAPAASMVSGSHELGKGYLTNSKAGLWSG
jgi:hypothetical protein